MNLKNIELENVKESLAEHTVATLTINFTSDDLKITGFRIMNKDDKMWVTPPSWKNFKTQQWHRIVILTKLEKWKELEEKIIEKYTKENLPIPNNSSTITDEEMSF